MARQGLGGSIEYHDVEGTVSRDGSVTSRETDLVYFFYLFFIPVMVINNTGI